MQALPVYTRPPVEQLRHEGDVVQVGLACDVVRSDQGCEPDALGPRDHVAGAAEPRPLGVLLVRVGLLALELVVQLLRFGRGGAGGGGYEISGWGVERNGVW